MAVEFPLLSSFGGTRACGLLFRLVYAETAKFAPPRFLLRFLSKFLERVALRKSLVNSLESECRRLDWSSTHWTTCYTSSRPSSCPYASWCEWNLQTACPWMTCGSPSGCQSFRSPDASRCSSVGCCPCSSLKC